MKHQLFRYLSIMVGTCLSGIAINGFFIPHQLLSGGLSGLCVILYYLFQWDLGYTNIILNIPLFILAYRMMSRDYFISGIFGTLALSFSLRTFTFLNQQALVHDPMLACIAGGVIHGMGLGILYRVGGSTGGSDIIGAIIQKFYSISIGTTGFIINIGLLLMGAFLFGVEPALYTMVAYFVVFKVANAFTDGFDYKKSILVISEKNDAIAEAIFQVVGRGVTYLESEGAYTHQHRKMLFVVVKLTQVAKVKELVKSMDPFAFMIIQDANDVFGRGFTQRTNHNVKRPPELRTDWQEMDHARTIGKSYLEKEKNVSESDIASGNSPVADPAAAPENCADGKKAGARS